MRRFGTAAAIVVLFAFVPFPCSSLAADGPSDLAKLFKTAFSAPEVSFFGGYEPGDELPINGITYYKGVILLTERGSLWIYAGGSWTQIEMHVLFDWGGPRNYLTMFETSCAPFGAEEFDIFGGTVSALLPGYLSFDNKLYRVGGGEKLFSQIKQSSYSERWINGVASLGCVMAVAERVSWWERIPKYDLTIFVPNDAFPGMVPLIDAGFTEPLTQLPLINGVDGILDGKIDPADQLMGGIELVQDEHGVFTLIVSMEYNLYLLEFEPEGMVATTIPLRTLQ